MANVIKIKRSSVPGKVPLTTDLEIGELAVNTADGILYTKHSDGNIKQLSRTTDFANITVSGNVVAGAYYDTTGNTINSLSVGIIDNNGNISNNISSVSTLRFDSDSGFDVLNLGNGVAKIAMNSTFKYWEVDGQSTLVATGLDTVKFIAGNGIAITTNANSVPQSLTISTLGGTQFTASANSPLNPVPGDKWYDTTDSILYIFVNDGSSTYWLDISTTIAGPTGATGPTGYIGSQGAVGFVGSMGATGPIGYTGSQGIAGYTGSQGDLGYSGSFGYTGSSGTTGYVGSRGDIGYTGSQGVIGYSGSQGVSGYTGSQGAQGVAGYTGSTGDIGYSGSQGVSGYTGSQGTAGFNGSKGDLGYTGSQGEQGVTGFVGSKGDAGSAGAQGNTGFTGSRGDTGYVGSSGSAGDVGFTGSQGVGFTGSAGAAGTNGFTGSRGDTGMGFTIAKTYANVASLASDITPSGILVGQFALIDTGNVDDPENSRLYLWTGNTYTYVNDLSGAAGITGPAGAAGYTGSAGGIGYTGSVGFAGSAGGAGAAGYTGSIGYSGSAGALTNWSKKTSNYSAVNGDRIIADTSGGSFTVTLPAAPAIGDYIKITDGYNFSANSLTVNRNGSTIENFSSNIIVDISSVDLEFIYDGSTWQIVSTTGPQGFTGYTGSQGSLGYTGSTGAGYTGSRGADGTVGVDGATGPIGYTGSVGAVGYTGSQGNLGYTGSEGTQGIEGYTGSQGITGYTGSVGAAGYSGSNGFTGSSGFTGSLGYTGSAGAGYTGSQGTMGATGATGALGFTGSQGAGYTGSVGYVGSAGTSGATGPQGPAGVTTSGTIVNNFTGNGVQTAFTLTVTPYDENETTVNIDGVVQLRTSYSVAGNVLTLDEAPAAGAEVEVTIRVYGTGSFVTRSFTGNGVQTTFTVTPGVSVDSVIVTENGLVQRPNIDYTVTGSTLTANTAPSNGVVYQIREIPTATIGATGPAGPAGSAGSLGYTGSIGYSGSSGIDGYTGSQGAVGFAGSSGALGYTGSAGANGFTGSQGAVGFAGSSGALGYTGSKGDTGLGFTIAKTYANVAALTADTSPTGITAGQFALIDTGNVDNSENSRLYLWSGSAYTYVNDLSGAAGITGPIGYSGSIGYTGSGVGNVLIASNVAPSSPYLGSQWFDTTANVIYQYVSDGVSSQWIDISTGLAIVVESNAGSGSGSGTVGYAYSGSTSNATETEIFINGTAGNRYTVDNNSSVGYEINVVGRNSDGSGHAYFKLLGLVRNNAGNVQDVGTLVETIVSRTYSNWVVDARASDATNSLNIFVQGSAGNTVTWSATMTVTKA